MNSNASQTETGRKQTVCQTVFAGVPSPPIELHVTGASRDFLSIAWKPPERDGGSPITGYHIEMCEAGTEKWMRVNSRAIKELKLRIEEGIVPEKEYVLRVRAINAVGVSEPSDISENVFAKDSDCKDLPTSCLPMILSACSACTCTTSGNQTQQRTPNNTVLQSSTL